MQELLRNAANGWSQYTQSGKYAVLLLAVLLSYWFVLAAGRSAASTETSAEISRLKTEAGGRKSSVHRLMLYTTVVMLLAVFPPTAVLLMMYQTRFYDYVWVFSLVPMTLVIAYGMTVFGVKYGRKYGSENSKGSKRKTVGIVIACLVLIFLCGNLHTEDADREAGQQKREVCAVLLDKLGESGNTEDICLWTTKDLLEHVRSLDGDIRLLYGRNMWDISLNAYSYDTYDEQTRHLYEWMEEIGQVLPAADPEAELTDEEALSLAIQKGVNCLILPAEQEVRLSESVLKVTEEGSYTVTSDDAEGYWILWIERSVS